MFQNKRVCLLLLDVLILSLASLGYIVQITPTFAEQAVTVSLSTQQATPGPSAEEPAQASSEKGQALPQVVYDLNHTENGLLLDSGGDVDYEVVSVGDPPEQADGSYRMGT